MPTILDPIPSEVQTDLNLLKTDLDLKIPSKKLEKNLLIATWNIRAFGSLTEKWKSGIKDSPKRDLHAAHCIAEILMRFDVIAVQEVKANLKALRHVIKSMGDNYAFLLTDVNQGNVGNDERMAYIFDTRRVQLSGLACELTVPTEWLNTDNGLAKEQFVRSPYAVSFRTQNQTFILVTVHILYGNKSTDRINELKGVAKWLRSWAADTYSYHQNLIVMGDFNIEERGDILNQTFISEGLFIPPQLEAKEVTRSIFDETKYYDQIAWFKDAQGVNNLTMEFADGGNYNFVGKALANRGHTKSSLSFMLSDHMPLWTEFKL
jgi:exonuclease III